VVVVHHVVGGTVPSAKRGFSAPRASCARPSAVGQRVWRRAAGRSRYRWAGAGRCSAPANHSTSSRARRWRCPLMRDQARPSEGGADHDVLELRDGRQPTLGRDVELELDVVHQRAPRRPGRPRPATFLRLHGVSRRPGVVNVEARHAVEPQPQPHRVIERAETGWRRRTARHAPSARRSGFDGGEVRTGTARRGCPWARKMAITCKHRRGLLSSTVTGPLRWEPPAAASPVAWLTRLLTFTVFEVGIGADLEAHGSGW